MRRKHFLPPARLDLISEVVVYACTKEGGLGAEDWVIDDDTVDARILSSQLLSVQRCAIRMQEDQGLSLNEKFHD